jgi:Protein of unknown function DUF262/Protein of unknown function (DUF1524)
VERLLSPGTTQFEVPIFQRRYAWGAEEIAQLIDDLFGESAQSELPYFLGSIVLARRDDAGDDAPDLVLDGQQRLTTVSLLISALIDRLKREGSSDADENKMYLFSKRVQGKKTPKIFLQAEDSKVFEQLIADPVRASEPKLQTSRLGLAVTKIFELLDEYSRSAQYKDISKPFAAMFGRLLYQVELVCITAPSERDAFRLFETLNDRGLALSAADLIKNKLFSRCKGELDDAVESWGNLLLLTKDDDVVNFLRTYWIAFKGFARKRGLYDTYRDHIDRLGPTEATLFVFDLEDSAKSYKEIVAPNPSRSTWGPDAAAGLERLSTSYRSRSCRPALLAFARFAPNDFARAIRLCESIAVRYSVVGEKNPNHLERMYSEMSQMLREGGDPWSRLREFSAFAEIPSDDEFRAKLATAEIPSMTSAWREVLIHLNGVLGAGELRVDRPNRVHVEHILPQSPRASALAEAGMSPEQAARAINRLGNLTLLSSRRNQELSNRPFSEKRSVYARSDVFLTRELAGLDRWNAAEIEARSQRLADAAVVAFPHPTKVAG